MAKKQKRTVKKKNSFNKKEFSLFMLIFALVGAFTLWVSFAAPHNGGGTGSYTITITPAAPYTFGEAIYITTTAPQVSGSYITLACYQNGALVLSSDHANFPTGWYYNWPYDLGPTQSWGGGAANCNVNVHHITHNKTVTDATTTFYVNG